MPEYMSDIMPDKIYLLDRMPECMPKKIPDGLHDRMSEYMST